MKKNEYWTVKFLKNDYGFKKGDYHNDMHKLKGEIKAYWEMEIAEKLCIPVKVRIEEVKK